MFILFIIPYCQKIFTDFPVQVFLVFLYRQRVICMLLFYDFFERLPFIAVYSLIPFLINTLHIFRCNAPHNPLHCVM